MQVAHQLLLPRPLERWHAQCQLAGGFSAGQQPKARAKDHSSSCCMI
jgi:hypothetical protein